MARKTVVIGLLGVALDTGTRGDRWSKWRPTVSLAQQSDLLVDRVELLAGARYQRLTDTIVEDVQTASPESTVRVHPVDFADPWDFEEVYATLHDFARGYPFDPEREDYLVHITTGTHVAQICLFLLTESRHIPGRLIQTSPPRRSARTDVGSYQVIDLDLSRYDRIAQRHADEHHDGQSFLKAGIETRSERFNAMMERIERVVLASRAPLLLTGPTGAGKTALARRVFELKRDRRQVEGSFVEINCATLRGDAAMSALFGHEAGAFTGAVTARDGLLRAADGGVLFLDEIGELGLDEQAMLLRAIEERRFLPVGADTEVASDFQLIAGSNRDLRAAVASGAFREDLLARIDLWSFALPGLRDRVEDIEPNIDFELGRAADTIGRKAHFNREARRRFVAFATDPASTWRGNFRDLNAAITRMATLAPAGRIAVDVVDEECGRLTRAWRAGAGATDRTGATDALVVLLGEERVAELDRFDRVQLADVVAACRGARSLSEAGRLLFSVSRSKKRVANDADRLRKYLARFGLDWAGVVANRALESS